MLVLLTIYLLIAGLFCLNWLNAFQKETNLSAEQKTRCRIVFIVATVLWPLTFPISYLENCSRV
ncbi:hypothetical protein [Coleofasciculus sp. C1-SOL-03]|uniref:hypothetical protein n=1 Tax=Coleofasciculus sp. C1-SOL-03 TaxID=3069522 RepID=UPI00406343AC